MNPRKYKNVNLKRLFKIKDQIWWQSYFYEDTGIRDNRLGNAVFFKIGEYVLFLNVIYELNTSIFYKCLYRDKICWANTLLLDLQ